MALASYSRNAGEFVKRWFADIGSAGGHRAMAKAVVPIDRFRAKYGDLTGPPLPRDSPKWPTSSCMKPPARES